VPNALLIDTCKGWRCYWWRNIWRCLYPPGLLQATTEA